MTHGWRRHHIQNVLTAPSMNLTNYMEKGQTISGRIKGFFGGKECFIGAGDSVIRERIGLYFSV